MEGRNREVRRLWESQGIQVSRLKRVRYGPLFLPSDVPVGTWKELTPKEITNLGKMLSLKEKRPVKLDTKEKEVLERRYKRQRSRREVGGRRKPSGE
jgi:23S rRNA pseudouridine2605 synthase